MAAAEASARSLLVRWANDQDGWVRALAGEVLATRRDLSATSLENAKALYLAEKQLSDGQPTDIPALGDNGEDIVAGETLRLISLRDCRGVNALAQDQEIKFGSKMTILFGENASGKTGYVRILKRLANVRSAEPIIADIHRPHTSSTPEAVVTYELSEQEEELTWHNESGVPPFTRMSVFDSPAVALHLEDNVRYVYTPADLALFKYVHEGIEGVKRLLEAELSAHQTRQNPFLTAFARGSSIYPKIESLSASTDIAELEKLATVSEPDRSELEGRRVTVQALSAASSENSAEMLRTRVTVCTNLITLAEALTNFQGDELAEALQRESAAREQQSNAASAVFRDQAPPDEARSAWHEFIQAGERLLLASGRDSYPAIDDSCIYCRQGLASAAVELLKGYRDYAGGAASAAVDAAQGETVRLRFPLASSAVDMAISGLEPLLPGMANSEQAPAWAADGEKLMYAAAELRNAVIAQEPVKAEDAQILAANLSPLLYQARKEAEIAGQGLQSDAQQKAALLTEERSKVADLEARLTLAQYMPDIRLHVERAAWAHQLSTLLTRFQGLLKSLTETTKVASEQALNKDFEQRFHEECQVLNAPTVTLDFPGRRGEAARRKSVASDYSLTEILSEGEQKVIAIADFLAESSLRGGSAPIVFDDPVVSLDYRRLHEIVRRIAALSAEHQVIAFTHNIWFAAELLTEFDKQPGDISYYEVIDDGSRKGVIGPATNPRVDTPAKVRGRINSAIQDATAAAAGEERTQKVEATYDHIRTWCETVVETDLLAKVTRRYQPNVAMQNLERIKHDRLKAATDVILPIFEKACRYIPGHSQSTETLSVRPTLEELQQDWANLQAALKDYNAD